MAQSLNVAIASTTSQPGALEQNLDQIIDFARRAGSDGAHLLLTPEMSATGYGNYPEVLALAEVAGEGAIYRALCDAARETNVVICAGFVEANPNSGGEKKHLSHYAIFPDGQFVVQRKHRLTHSEQPLEPEYSQLPPFNEDGTGTPAQTNFQIFEVNGIACAVVICADAGIANVKEDLAARGVKMILQPTGAGGNREDRFTNEELRTSGGREKYAAMLEKVFFPGQSAIIDSLRLGQAMAAVNLCGYDGRRHYHLGHGMIVTPQGEVPALIHGLPNLDCQRPLYTHAQIDFEPIYQETIPCKN